MIVEALSLQLGNTIVQDLNGNVTYVVAFAHVNSCAYKSGVQVGQEGLLAAPNIMFMTFYEYMAGYIQQERCYWVGHIFRLNSTLCGYIVLYPHILVCTRGSKKYE